ncbi:rhodanese-like domain-containing protein [Silvanigrella paludirubra]|jgi:rhodanese-related sulfurtransferase|uniref:Rhodanese-like domain-containing protein n=1 Tax=Silvanigrella paludirubra TaxID=2499159 RepID=A0A6N6VRQ0_9BACT|nr:rhodanese-like domain-containing protein [Silvanigrella paludirubra]KAB8038062.1 rhodanese-like domain-containing protein [Silvanigrella paludirubra]
MKLSCVEFAKMYKDGDLSKKVLLDVRDVSECSAGMLNGSINIPVAELDSRFSEISKDKEIFIYCKSGGRAERAEMFLNYMGFKETRVASPGGYNELKDLI